MKFLLSSCAVLFLVGCNAKTSEVADTPVQEVGVQIVPETQTNNMTPKEAQTAFKAARKLKDLDRAYKIMVQTSGNFKLNTANAAVMGDMAYKLKKFDAAKAHFLSAENLFSDTTKPNLKIGVYKKMANSCKKLETFDCAISAKTNELSLAMVHGKPSTIPAIYRALASFHQNNDDITQALQNYDLSTTEAIKLNKLDFAAINHSLKGQLYLKSNDKPLACSAMTKAVELAKQAESSALQKMLVKQTQVCS